MDTTFTLPTFWKGGVMSSLDSFLAAPAVTAAEIAARCNVARTTITHWMHKGWLHPIGRYRRGALLFRPDEALEADVKARSHTQRSRRRKAVDGTVREV